MSIIMANGVEVKKLSDLINLISEEPPLLFDKFTDLSAAPDIEPWDSIKKISLQNGLVFSALSAIANGAVTSQKTEFLFSRAILERMLTNLDPNKEPVSMSGSTYGKILAQLTDPKINFMVCVKRGTKTSKHKRAAIFKLTSPVLLEFIDKKPESRYVSTV